MTCDQRLMIFTSGDKGYLWTPNEALRIRRDQRIVGISVGAFSKLQSQKNFCSLPLHHSMEDTNLTIRKGWGKTVLFKSESLRENISLIRTKCVNPLLGRIICTNILSSISLAGENDIMDLDESGTYRTIKSPSIYVVRSLELTYATSVCQTISLDRAVKIPHIPRNLGKPAFDLNWPYPCTVQQRAQCAVVEDLHCLGFLVSDGGKFGGEFLAYSGDPELYHSQFVIRVLASDKCLPLCILIAQARTSHGSRKHLIFAHTKEVPYIPNALIRRQSSAKDHPINYLLYKSFLYQRPKRIRATKYVVSVSYITFSPESIVGESKGKVSALSKGDVQNYPL